jgi:hypothetical protein
MVLQRALVLCAASVALLACGFTSELRPSTTPAAPRSEGCDFRLLTLPPAAPFTEVGVVYLKPVFFNHAAELDELKARIGPEVCKAGGNAAVTLAPFGGSQRVTVIKLLDATAPVAASRCVYDAQCKGDRICVNGACEPPRPK